MSEQDDIFDIEDFIEEKGDKYIKKAWRDHMEYFTYCENHKEELRRLQSDILALKRILRYIEDIK